MSFSILLIVLSLALFAYWFRYSCLLILRTQTAEDFGHTVSRANGLSFDQVKVEIEKTPNRDLMRLYENLERDYRVVTQLLEQVAAAAPQDNLMEEKLLRANFRVTQYLFRVSHKLGLSYERTAIVEMAEMVGHFANTFGQQNLAQSASA